MDQVLPQVVIGLCHGFDYFRNECAVRQGGNRGIIFWYQNFSIQDWIRIFPEDDSRMDITARNTSFLILNTVSYGSFALKLNLRDTTILAVIAFVITHILVYPVSQRDGHPLKKICTEALKYTPDVLNLINLVFSIMAVLKKNNALPAAALTSYFFSKFYPKVFSHEVQSRIVRLLDNLHVRNVFQFVTTPGLFRIYKGATLFKEYYPNSF